MRRCSTRRDLATRGKTQTVANLGPLLSLWILKNAMGLTDAETIDRCLVLFRDTWQHTSSAVSIPHPGYRSVAAWKQAQSQISRSPVVPSYHRGANVGANMLWGLALLPGKVDLNNQDDALADRPKLAQQRGGFLRYMRHVMEGAAPGTPRDRLMSTVATNYQWIYG